MLIESKRFIYPKFMLYKVPDVPDPLLLFYF